MADPLATDPTAATTFGSPDGGGDGSGGNAADDGGKAARSIPAGSALLAYQKVMFTDLLTERNALMVAGTARRLG